MALIDEHFNAFHVRPERPLALCGGGATCVRGRRTFSLTVGANTIVVYLFNVRGGNYVGTTFQYNGGAAATHFDDNLTTQMYTPAPDTSLQTKGSIHIVDVTKTLDRGGVVKVLRTPQSILIAPGTTVSTAEQLAIVDYIRGSPHTIVHSQDLVEGKTWHQNIVDGTKYQAFRSHPTSVNDLLDELDDPGMSTIAFLFESYAGASRTFEVTYAATAYVRYPAIGVLQSMQKPIPRTTQETIMSHNSVLDRLGSAANAVGSAAIQGVEAAAGQVAYMATGRALAGALGRFGRPPALP